MPTPGKKIAVLQDTCDSSNAVQAANGCDLLIHESTYHNDLNDKAIKHGHSTSGERKFISICFILNLKNIFLIVNSFKFVFFREIFVGVIQVWLVCLLVKSKPNVLY